MEKQCPFGEQLLHLLTPTPRTAPCLPPLHCRSQRCLLMQLTETECKHHLSEHQDVLRLSSGSQCKLPKQVLHKVLRQTVQAHRTQGCILVPTVSFVGEGSGHRNGQEQCSGFGGRVGWGGVEPPEFCSTVLSITSPTFLWSIVAI